MNIWARTVSARAGSTASRPSRIIFSVDRSARLMIATSGSTPPTEDISWGPSTVVIRRSSSLSTSRITSGLAGSIERSGTPPWPAGSAAGRRAPPPTAAGPGGPAPGDGLRVLIGQEGEQLPGVGLADALERHLGQGGAEALHDLLGPVAAQTLGQQLPGQVHTAAGTGLGGQVVVRLGQHRLASIALTSLRRTISPVSSSTRSSGSNPMIRAAFSWPSWTRKMAALRIPGIT